MSTVPSLAQHRQRRGWSQAQLAEQTAVSRAEISAIETGRVIPSVAVAIRLAAALNESVEGLFGGTPTPPANLLSWAPSNSQDPRVWRAVVNGKLLTYPVEATAAGALPHDSKVTERGLQITSPETRPERTLVIAGCDPLVGVLMHEMAERHAVRVIPLLRSSNQALELLRQGLVHIAGVHLTDTKGRSANDAVVRARLGRGQILIHQLRWEAGIAVAQRRRERTVRELLRANVRWVNREEGSAARAAFDTVLGSAPRPKGYRYEVRDHRAVAATVSSGWAEAGVCIRPAAAEVHLRFIALQQEAYELCVPDSLLEDPRVTALRTTLASLRYRQFIGDVPGCLARDAGQQRAVA